MGCVAVRAARCFRADGGRCSTLRSTEAVHRRVDAFFDPLGDRLGALMAGYPDEFLSRIDEFLRAVTQTLDEHGRAASQYPPPTTPGAAPPAAEPQAHEA